MRARGVDAVVVGAGIIGAACARELAGAGLSVTVLDRDTPASATTAHGEGNVLVSDKGPGAELRLARTSVELWPRVLAELREELGPGFPDPEWNPKGGLVVATTGQGAEALSGFAAGQRAAGVDARPVEPADVPGHEPSLTRDLAGAVYYPEDAQVQPVVAAEAMLASARARGATVRHGTPVIGALRDRSGGIVGVRTPTGRCPAGLVVNAAGPWAGDLAGVLGVALPVRPRRGMVLVIARLAPTVFHKVYDADYVGAIASGSAELQTSTVVESTRAGTILVGSSRQQIGFDARVRVPVLAEIAAKAARLFPPLARVPVIRSYGGFRPFVPDHLPIIGADPRLTGLWHATGHEGAGIGLSVATGRLLRQSVLGETPLVDPGPFHPDRPGIGEPAPPTATH